MNPSKRGPRAGSVTSLSALALVGLALAGCATSPHTADTRLPAAYAALAAPALPEQALEQW